MLQSLKFCCSQTKYILRYSTIVKLKETPAENTDLKESLKQSARVSKVRPISHIRKPQRPPFVKNLFVGIFDDELMAYPEALEKENAENMLETTQPLAEYFAASETQILASNGLTNNYTSALRDLQLMGLRTSQLSGGKELNVTEACLHHEKILECTSNNNYLAHELLGLQTLLKCGNKEQQDKYLDGVSSGRIVTGFCVIDPVKVITDSSRTKAVFDIQTKTWTLNGTKAFVINGNTAELFIVLAETKVLNARDRSGMRTTMFLVDKSALGVSTSKHVSIGLNGLDIATVEFNNVVISQANVIGLENQAVHILKVILPEYRLSSGPALIALSKRLSTYMLNWIKEQESTDSTNYCTSESIYTIMSNITKSIYAMESMTYFTSGLLDMYTDQDCEIEATIVKIFSSEQCIKNTLSCLEMIGPSGYSSNHWINEIYRDATTYLILNEPIKHLKLSAALLGLQHAGVQLQQLIKTTRNPLFHPLISLKRVMNLRHHISDNPKLTIGIKYHLHPSLTVGGDAIEYCVLRLQYATEVLFSRHGIDVIIKHNDLERLADAVVDIFAMIACTARASRSYCIGLQHAEHELLMANAICLSLKDKVRETLNDVCDGEYINMDESFMTIGKKSIVEHQYYPVHPLSRNF